MLCSGSAIQMLELPTGLNFQDHVTGPVLDLVITGNSSSVPASPEGWVAAQREYDTRQNGPMATYNVMSVLAFYNTSRATAEWPDIEVSDAIRFDNFITHTFLKNKKDLKFR